MSLSGFTVFDAAAGGLASGRSYLVHGPLGSGKTTLALQFLLEGLKAGERGALVVRRSAPVVLDQARAFGFELGPFVSQGLLALFEYAPHVVENCARLKKDEEIFDEFCAALPARVKRLVFDPVTPLLSSCTNATLTFRARALVNAFGQLGATTLYLCDSPEGDPSLPGLRDVVYGSLRLQASGGAGRGQLVPEQLPGFRLGALDYEVQPGVGLVAAQAAAPAPGVPAAEPREKARRRVLVLIPGRQERERVESALSGDCTVDAHADAADGLARMAATPPDLVVIDEHAGSLEGSEFCRKLRASGLNVPVILIAAQLRRSRDRVALLASGADECLERPLDPRLLRMKSRALMARYDPGANRLVDPAPATTEGVDPGDGITFTTDFTHFMTRVSGECEAAQASGVAFAIVAVQAAGPEGFPFLCQRLQRVVREYDLVCARDTTAFVLLAETEEKGVFAFIDRLERASAPDEPPACAHLWLPAAQASLATIDAFVERSLAPLLLSRALASGE